MMFHRHDARHRKIAGLIGVRHDRRYKGGKGGGSKSPDASEIARAQALANKEAVLESAKVSQIGEISPFGTQRYVGRIGEPDRTRIIELPDDAQRLLDVERRIGLQLAGPAMARAIDITKMPEFSLEGLTELPGLENLSEAAEPVERATYERIRQLQEPELARRRHDVENKAIVRGIPVGSEAWQREMDQLAEEEREANLGASLEGVRQGRAEQSRLFGLTQAARQQDIADLVLSRTQPIQELAAALQGSPAMPMPNFGPTPGFGVAPPDLVSAYGLEQRGREADQAATEGLMTGLFGLGAGAILTSAEEMKDVGDYVVPKEATAAIRKMPIRHWRYKGGGPRW